jgi:dihydroflavonol-4-reductase
MSEVAPHMLALVTGATGFVGANLAQALAARGDDVRVLRRSTSRLDALTDVPVTYVTGDLLDAGALEEAMSGCDVVFHVAALSQYWRTSKETIYRVNVDGTRNVMAAALVAGVGRVVHTSSIAALGIPVHDQVLDETAVFPDSQAWFTYGHSKYLAEVEVRRAVDQGLPAVIVNPGIVIGPRDINFVSGSIIRASVKGQLRIVPPGGSNIVHVADVVAGQLAAAERGRVGERYILGGENLSHWDAAVTAAAVTGGLGPLTTLPSWSLNPLAMLVDAFNGLSPQPPLLIGQQLRLGGLNIYVDSSKAIRELGLPQTPFREAAQDAFDWYRDNGLI